MFGIHIMSVYLLAVGLLTLLAAVLIWQTHRSGKTVIVWLSSGVVGILLGSVGTVALVCLSGYDVTITPKLAETPGGDVAGAPAGGEMEGMGGGMPGMGGSGGMSGGPGMGGPPGGMGGGPGMGGPPQPRPKRDLTNLVRKVALLTGDVGITLSGEQAAAFCNALADIEKAETMSDDDAQAKLDEVMALMDEEQKGRLEAVDLPRRRGGGRGGPGGGGPGGPGGGGQAEDANPFQDEANAEALNRLRERFGPTEKPAEESAEKAAEESAEKPPAEQ